MAKQLSIQTSKDIKEVDRTEIAVKIVGATLNGDTKNLLAIIKKSTEDSVSYMALSGLFHLLSQDSEESIPELLDLEYDSSSGYQELLALFLKFEKILEKKDYKKYPVAVLPSSNVKSGDFMHESFSGILKKCLHKIFSASHVGSYSKEDAFEGPDFVNCIFRIVSSCELIDSGRFFRETVTTITCDVLDANYINGLLNSKNKIWDAQRAARDYFLRVVGFFYFPILRF